MAKQHHDPNKKKCSPRTGPEGEKRHISTLSSTSAFDGGG